MPRREPEAEHGGGDEGRDQKLHADRGGAEPSGQLDLADRGHGAREPIAAGAPEQPQPREGEQEDRRPAEQAVLAVEEERDQTIGPLQVAARERGVGGRLARDIGGVGGGTAVQGLVDPHVQRHAEERQLDGADGEGSPAHPPQRPRAEVADDEPGREELGAEPGEHPEQREAAERVPPAWAVVEPQGEQRGAGERGARSQLGVDRGAVGEERRAQSHRQSRPDRPRVGHHPQRQPVGQRHGKGANRRQEQLDPLRPAERVGRGDQERKARAVGLVQLPLRLLAVLVQLVRVEVVVGAGAVLVVYVQVPVFDDRLRREKIVGLIAAVVGVPEGIQPDGGGVDTEEQEPEGGGPSHGRRASTPAVVDTPPPCSISVWRVRRVGPARR
jgi:hypothetical protein